MYVLQHSLYCVGLFTPVLLRVTWNKFISSLVFRVKVEYEIFCGKVLVCTGLFISPSGISELDCTTTKTDTAERSITIGRESIQVFFVLGALAYFQVPPLGGSREEKWRSQWIRKRSVSWNLSKLSQLWLCNGDFGSCTTQNHLQTKQFVNGTWIPAEWLPVRFAAHNTI